MPGAEEEASALDAYYAATNEAKELIGQNLVDVGMSKWERALQDLGQYISHEQLNALKAEFHNFQLRRHEIGINDDTDSNCSNDDNGTEDSGNESGNFIPEADASAVGENYRAEHKKLAKRHTMRGYTNPRRVLNRSSTISGLERRGTAQISRTNLTNDFDQSHTPRGNGELMTATSEEIRAREPTTGSEPMLVSEPTTSPTVDESNFSGQPKGVDLDTRISAQPRPSTAPAGSVGSKENDDWFGNLKSIAHKFVYGQNKEFWPTQPVKVAILDSGFVLSGKARAEMKPYLGRIKGHMTFTTEFSAPRTPRENQQALDDPVGHGTTVAYQLMKTCPSADVYIAKVTVTDSTGKRAVPDKAAVTCAIRHAATPVADGGWGVDVINMSFGWAESELPRTPAAVNGLSGAIEFAAKQGVLLFAAASNYGLTERNDVFYPARDPQVISVDAEDGFGNPARFALQSVHHAEDGFGNPARFALQSVHGSGGFRYCAPGLSVGSPVSATPMCGSSFACPVAAGVAALVLEFARHKNMSLSESMSVKNALSSAQGMLKVFGLMVQQAANHPGFGMLYPWHFLRGSQREKIALDIIDQLEIEFGRGIVGREIVYTLRWQAAQTTPTNGSILQATPI
ncbi:peptidase S8/S53 domain-containing protein [Xylariaceae sp. AK1471]|nr:peptidase S8/S53 domain-containing protein [Xylariaceae sp. AK1471]